MEKAEDGVRCPEGCGEMNHHADKLVEPPEREEQGPVDPTWEGCIEQVFACPNCGRVESRRLA